MARIPTCKQGNYRACDGCGDPMIGILKASGDKAPRFCYDYCKEQWQNKDTKAA